MPFLLKELREDKKKKEPKESFLKAQERGYLKKIAYIDCGGEKIEMYETPEGTVVVAGGQYYFAYEVPWPIKRCILGTFCRFFTWPEQEMTFLYSSSLQSSSP